MWSKMTFLTKAIKDNYFNTSHFCWCDFGITHIADTKYTDDIFNDKPDKIKYLSIRAYNNTINDIKIYFSSFRWNFAGGFFSGPMDKLLLFINKFDQLVQKVLAQQLLPNDEQLFGYIAYYNPELFDFYNGDYKTILSNYFYICDDIHWVHKYIDESIQNGDYQRAMHAGERFWLAVKSQRYFGTVGELALSFVFYILANYLNDCTNTIIVNNIDLINYFIDLINQNEKLKIEVYNIYTNNKKILSPDLLSKLNDLFKLNIAICVMATAINDKYINQIKACFNTWYKTAKEYNIVVKFFGGYMHYDNQDYINLPGVAEDYQSASSKQFLGLKYLYQNHKSDYYVVVGTDNYINIANLYKFLNRYNKNTNNNLYLGGHGWPAVVNGKQIHYHSGGAGFILNHNCLKLIIDNIDNIIKTWPALCAASPAGNDMLPACDVTIAYHLSVLE